MLFLCKKVALFLENTGGVYSVCVYMYIYVYMCLYMICVNVCCVYVCQ